MNKTKRPKAKIEYYHVEAKDPIESDNEKMLRIVLLIADKLGVDY
jgi:hypothetical protein